MNNRWKQITRLFTKALKLDEADRDAWLEEACGGDRELFEEVDSLVRAYTSPGLPGQSLEELRAMAFLQMDEKEMKGKQIGPFHLQELIGAGGMGVVYRARDIRLERDVAIKFPPPAWSLNERVKERFLHEARAAASLDHPNVCTIYETGEMDNGALYMAMAYYQGKTLQQRLEKGPLPVGDALDIALQTARGLDSAHGQGLVHRDIKPANLMITPGGTLKILDFGIAKVTDAGLTAAGQRPGTAAYMAPEQARGEDVDTRADLWSLGVVLYEMLTGTRPSKEPEPPSALRPEIPSTIDDLFFWLLDPDPANRPEQARDVAAFLEKQIEAGHDGRPGSMTRSGRRRRVIYPLLVILVVFAGLGTYFYFQQNSVQGLPPDHTYTLAVLPFTNIGGDPDEEYFSDGITEDLLTYLSRNSNFRVISRTSVINYRDSGRNLMEIGDELGATHILEGSVRRAGERVRITVQLIDARTGHQLWAESYDRNLENILAIQSEISRSIAETLEGRLLAADEIPAPNEVNTEAHDFYLQGRFLWHQRSEERMKQAIVLFEEAVELAPDYSYAWEGLADAYAVLGFYDYLAPDESFPLARNAARRALELDPGSASAWATLGYVALYYDWDLERGEDAFRRAIDLSPGYSKARQWYANLLNVAGRFDEAEWEMRRARELDPLSLIANAALGWVLYYAGHNQAAIEQCRRALNLNPNFELAYLWTGWALEAEERYDESLEMLEEAVNRSGGSGISVASLARLHALRGETAKAEALLFELETAGNYVPSYEIAKAYLGLNRLPEAISWMERAIDERSHSTVFLHVDPQLEKLREDPAFEMLVRQASTGNN